MLFSCDQALSSSSMDTIDEEENETELGMNLSLRDNEVLEGQEYLDWYKENMANFHGGKVLGEINVGASFIPSEIKYLQEKQQLDGEIKTNKGDSAVQASYNEYEYYTVTISMKDEKSDILKSGASNLSFEALVEYLSFKIQKDFLIEAGGKEYACKQHVFERSFGLNPAITLNLVFESIKNAGARKLVYKDELFGLGTVKFKVVSSKNISSIPQLKE